MPKTKDIAQLLPPGARVISQLHCHRCGVSWYPKNPDRIPTVCPRCKNPRWNIPRPAEQSEAITPTEQTALDAYLRVLRSGVPRRVRAIRTLVEMEAESLGMALEPEPEEPVRGRK